MASPSELTLDYKPNTTTNTTSYPLIQKSTFGDLQPPESTSQIKLEDFLARLEEERHKIEAFKRELPLCMQLLNNAMETYRRQLETYQNNNNNNHHGPRPVLEEFIPLTNMSINCSDKSAAPTSEKANWMVSAQLWSTATEPTNTKLALDTKQRNGSGGGAFLPFSKEKAGSNKGLGPGPRALPELALAASVEEEAEDMKCEVGSNGGVVVSKGVVGGGSESKGGSNGNDQGQAAAAAGGQSTHRKARRCWSPDLHRRFVNALQMLGGSQVATPKQIRELMKVDGLTNDEVKSHLQKYRLHTRRPIHPPQPPAAAAPQLVVLGGIWVPPEYASAAAAAAAAGAPAIYPAAPTAAHYSVAHHDFYAPPPPPPGTHPHLHRATTAAGPYARARVAAAHSPESELRSSGDRSESIEDGEDGEEREADEEDDGGQEEAEEMEEVKAEDKALVPVEGNGNVGDVALKF